MNMKKTSSKNRFLLISIFSTLVAIGIHAYLTQQHYGLKFGAIEGQSLCNINKVLNCDAVSASSYSALFGIPMALWGVFTNVVLLYFLLVTRFNLVEDSDKTSRYSLLISSVTVVASLVMGTIALTLMHNICIFCIAAYILSFIGFFGTWMAAEKASIANLKSDIADIFTTERWVGGFLISIPVMSVLGNIMYLESHGFSEIEKITTEKVAYWQVSPPQTFDLSTGLSFQSSTVEPKLTIVEFADFRCPHCKHAAPTLHAFANSHPDVRLIFKPFPLDGTCNEAIQGGRGDGISCGLAAAVMCAEKISQKGWAAHDYFFEIQSEIIQAQNLDKNLESASKALSLPLEELKTCIKSSDTLELVRKMAKEGENAKIQGTPTVFANNKLLSGGQLIPVLEAAYRSLNK